MNVTKRTIRDYDKPVTGEPRLIFDKVCKCGNHMGITLTKRDGGTEISVTEREDFSYTCFMVGDSTAQCVSCGKRYRSYHHAYQVEARLD